MGLRIHLFSSMRHWSQLAVFACLAVVSCGETSPVPDMLAPDLVVHGGKIITVDNDFRVVSAVAIKDGRFIAVGDEDQILPLRGVATHVIDLEGTTVIPGVIDSHIHAFGYGLDRSALNFATGEMLTLEGILEHVRGRAAQTPPGEWIVARGPFSLEFVREGRLPDRYELDEVAPDNPFYMNTQGHDGNVNSLALEMAGITRETPDPVGGTIVRDEDGVPTGELLEEFAWGPVERLTPVPTREDMVEAARLAVEGLNAAGITSLVDMDGPLSESRDKIEILNQLEANGDLTIRWHVLTRFRGTEYANASAEVIDEAVRDIGAPSGFGSEWVRIAGIKLSLDGGVQGAYMREPYAEEQFGTGYRGILRGWDKESLKMVMRSAHKYGVRMFVHCVGDAALDLALDAMDEVDDELPLLGLRWTLEHAGLKPTERNLEQAKRLGVVISTQQPMGWTIGKSFKRMWGDELGSNWMPNKTWVDAGVVVKGGSDVAPIDPMLGLWTYVTREDITGAVSDSVERVSREEALRMYTINGAYGTFQEDMLGSIEVGKLADLVILGGDPLTVPVDEIRDIPILVTIAGGQIVYEADSP
jgi:predicted amidohydrolase YtcJ